MVCKKYAYACTGIKSCEYLHLDLVNMYHFKLTKDDWETIINLCKEYTIDTKQKQANR